MGAGLERAYLRVRDNSLPVEERAIQKTVYTGSKLIALKSLTMANCEGTDAAPEAIKRFGRGL